MLLWPSLPLFWFLEVQENQYTTFLKKELHAYQQEIMADFSAFIMTSEYGSMLKHYF